MKPWQLAADAVASSSSLASTSINCRAQDGSRFMTRVIHNTADLLKASEFERRVADACIEPRLRRRYGCAEGGALLTGEARPCAMRKGALESFLRLSAH